MLPRGNVKSFFFRPASDKYVIACVYSAPDSYGKSVPRMIRSAPSVSTAARIAGGCACATVSNHMRLAVMLGFSGGRKLVAPGLAAQETIKELHSSRFMRQRTGSGDWQEVHSPSMMHMRSITQPWRCKDGRWYLPHFNLPHLHDRVIGVLKCESNADAVAKAAGPFIGDQLAATTWQEQNRHILDAFKMERIVTVVTISLIQLVGALNILITLVMMVMEKHRDIAILMSMGARAAQIRKIFILKGAMIGGVGTAIGLVLGYTISFLADRYHWLALDQEVYSLAYVPLESNWTDAIWIAAAAMDLGWRC